jgi:hypothetical protein
VFGELQITSMQSMVALNHFRALRSGQDDNHLKEKQYITLKIIMGVRASAVFPIHNTIFSVQSEE